MDNLTGLDAQLHRLALNGLEFNDKLPISKYQQTIVDLISRHNTVIIHGVTGCGKTTQVPQYILGALMSRGQNANIIVTQPRRIAAITLARHVCEERNWDVGGIVGYQVGQDAKVSDRTQIVYCTLGIFLQEVVRSGTLGNYTHIILDEIHEREEEMDLAMLLIRRLRNEAPSRAPKLIVMSATIDLEKLTKYLGNPPVVGIDVPMFKVEERYLDDLYLDVPFSLDDPWLHHKVQEEVVKLVETLELEEGRRPDRGTVLIFVPGMQEIRSLQSAIAAKAKRLDAKWEIVLLHSSISTTDQRQAFTDVAPHRRRIIISTNIAESSITVPHVRFVIDLCLTKQIQRDDGCSFTALRLAWASKSNCQQRKGRAGRVQAGRVYRMVSRSFYNSLPEHAVPEMLRIPLHSTVMKVKKLGIRGSIYDILSDAIDPPEPDDIRRSVLELIEAGALSLIEPVVTRDDLDLFDGELTNIGKIMAELPLEPALSRLILFGLVFNLLDEAIIIAACLSSRSFMDFGMEDEVVKYKVKAYLSRGKNCDMIAALNLYQSWKSLKDKRYGFANEAEERKWCKDHCVSRHRIEEADKLVSDLRSRVESLDVTVPASYRSTRSLYGGWDKLEDTSLALQFIIAGAFYPNYFFSTTPSRDLHRPIKPDPRDFTSVNVKVVDLTSRDVCPVALKQFFIQNIGVEPESVESTEYDSVRVSFGQSEWTSDVPLPVSLALKLRTDRNLNRLIQPAVVHDDDVDSFLLAEQTAKPRKKRVRIDGPFNPCELNGFKGLTNDVMSMVTNVVKWSLNSVIVNTASDRRFRRMLVAAKVNSNGKDRLFLDHTSLMPAIPGFREFALLVFAPHVRVVREKNSQFYVAVKGDVGKFMKDGKPRQLWPEHKFVEYFDHKMDLNIVRMALTMRTTISACFEDRMMKHMDLRRVLLPRLQECVADQFAAVMSLDVLYAAPDDFDIGGPECTEELNKIDMALEDEDLDERFC